MQKLCTAMQHAMIVTELWEKTFVQHDWVECTGIVYAGTRLINKYEYTGNRCKAGNWLTGLQGRLYRRTTGVQENICCRPTAIDI